MPETATPAAVGSAPIGAGGAGLIAAVAQMSDDELRGALDRRFRDIAAAQGDVVVMLGEVDRRQSFRAEGATSTQTWAADRFGVSSPTARALTQVGEKAWCMPQLVGSLCAGEVSLDKVRALADVATPETDSELCDQAKACSVRQLADTARQHAAAAAAAAALQPDFCPRSSLPALQRQCRTMTVQLPPESFAEARACLEARAKHVSSDGETPWDQRLCDAFLGLLRSSATPDAEARTTTSSPYLVVVHTPLGARHRRPERSGRRAGASRPDRRCDRAQDRL